MKHKFIVFEGTDASGKSTLANQLAKELKGVYYYNPPKILNYLREYADNSSLNARFQFYMLANYLTADEVKRLLEKTDVVVDWYVYGTIAYHSVLMNKELKIPDDLLLPDNIIYVMASPESIQKRLNERPKIGKFEKIDFLKKVMKKYDSLLKNCKNVIKVDTTNQSINETKNESKDVEIERINIGNEKVHKVKILSSDLKEVKEGNMSEIAIDERGDIVIWLKLNATYCNVKEMDKTYYIVPESRLDGFLTYNAMVYANGDCKSKEYFESAKFSLLDENISSGPYDLYRDYNGIPLLMGKFKIVGKLPKASVSGKEEVNIGLLNQLIQSVIEVLAYIRGYFEGFSEITLPVLNISTYT